MRCSISRTDFYPLQFLLCCVRTEPWFDHTGKTPSLKANEKIQQFKSEVFALSTIWCFEDQCGYSTCTRIKWNCAGVTVPVPLVQYRQPHVKRYWRVQLQWALLLQQTWKSMLSWCPLDAWWTVEPAMILTAYRGKAKSVSVGPVGCSYIWG